MKIKQNYLVIGGIVLLLIIVIGGAVVVKGGLLSKTITQTLAVQQTSTEDPIDIVSDFYNLWLSDLQSTSTDPYQSGLAKEPILSKTLSDRLVASIGHPATDPDPVLCQTKLPTKVAARVVYTLQDSERILMTAKDKDLTGQAIVTLKKLNDGWYIDEITCAPGEFEAPREFSFENEGFLLGKNVPKPYDPKDWHLIFAQDGVQGHVVPLFFGADSMCTAPDGTTAVCDPSTFEETTKVSVHGQMTEYGVDVKKMEVTNEEFKAS